MVDELKAMKIMPPQLLTSLFPVAILLGHKANPDGVKTMLKGNFLDDLNNFDFTTVTNNRHKMIDKYVHNREFTP
jgi:hypothetical protein